MAQHDVVILNEVAVPPQLQEPQAGDSYRLPADVEIVGDLTISGTVDGADVAAMAALAASATQPGDNLSTLVNDILASQAEAEAGSNNTKMMTPLRVAQAIAVLAAGLQNKLDAVSDPLPTNDDSEGYAVGSFWINVTTDQSWRCVDATTNVAVWVKTTLQTSDLAIVALSGDSDDLVEGTINLLLTAAERAKLAGVEAGATADQTGAEIKAAYEAEADTNAFTDAHKARVDDLIGQLTGITAFAGGGQASATVLTKHFNFVDTVGSIGDSVKLPVGTAGATIVVKNRTATSLDLFPQSGVQIDALGADVALAIPGGDVYTLFCISPTQWETIGDSV
jgi:hypothetical protein